MEMELIGANLGKKTAIIIKIRIKWNIFYALKIETFKGLFK